ncbi:hypothetical protein DFH06DRAFT_1188318 [Mycena polygramma]|nr:hypothetical protein DFH06DRAFT_1188318 [Mycena polygramma]
MSNFFSSETPESQNFEAIKTHKGDISHELLAGAASFAAAHEYTKHCAANGKPQSHAEAIDLLAGFAGAFIDHEAETRGMDEIAKQKAKRAASDNASEAVRQKDFQ